MSILLWLIPTLLMAGLTIRGTGALLTEDAPKPATEAFNKYFEGRD